MYCKIIFLSHELVMRASFRQTFAAQVNLFFGMNEEENYDI
jgi:hypothetical protein